jgi:hypothetical protein
MSDRVSNKDLLNEISKLKENKKSKLFSTIIESLVIGLLLLSGSAILETCNSKKNAQLKQIAVNIQNSKESAYIETIDILQRYTYHNLGYLIVDSIGKFTDTTNVFIAWQNAEGIKFPENIEVTQNLAKVAMYGGDKSIIDDIRLYLSDRDTIINDKPLLQNGKYSKRGYSKIYNDILINIRKDIGNESDFDSEVLFELYSQK